MKKSNRKILEEHTEFILKKINSFRFTPPLDADSCSNYVLERITVRLDKYDKKIHRVIPFLNKVVTNLVLDYYRKHNKTEPPLPKQTCSAIWNGSAKNPDIDTNTPETDYWQDRENKILHEEIDKLDPENKQIVELYYFSNYTEEKIGKKVGLARNTISVRLKKSLAKIKPRIEERLDELEKLKEEL